MCVKTQVTEHGWNIRHRKGTVVRRGETETPSSVLQAPADPDVATYSMALYPRSHGIKMLADCNILGECLDGARTRCGQ